MVRDVVKLIECPRDAWQGLKRQIPTDLKVRYLRALIAAGFRHIDAVSFVSPKAVPQMGDSDKVMVQIDRPDDVEIIGIVVNEKGADRAIATKAITTLGFPCSISETFLRRNQNQTIDGCYSALHSIKIKADTAGIGVVAYISMAFGNPYGDAWDANQLHDATNRLVNMGVRSISLADTVAVADPDLIRRVVEAVISAHPEHDVGVHLHSAPETAAEKVFAAYDAGCRRFDSAIGGLGGCPFAQDAMVGNIPTETVIAALQQRGVDIPIGKSLADVFGLNSIIAASYRQ